MIRPHYRNSIQALAFISLCLLAAGGAWQLREGNSKPIAIPTAAPNPILSNLSLQQSLANRDRGKPADLSAPAHARSGIKAAYSDLPLAFEKNQGQTDRRVKYLSRGSGYALFLTPTEAVLSIHRDVNRPTRANSERKRGVRPQNKEVPDSQSAVLRMRLAGANAAPEVSAVERLPGRSNYFKGEGSEGWHTNVPQFARVRYHDVYQGVDLDFYGNHRQLEYDFVVAPGADPHGIQVTLEGLSVGQREPSLRIEANGDLVAETSAGPVCWKEPTVYQVVEGQKRLVAASYDLHHESNSFGFHLASYDKTRPLIIDPALVYSTYLGGSSEDEGFGIAVDSTGNAYITGRTRSMNFPTPKNPFQRTEAGDEDAFVLKINSTGTSILYSTYLGGTARDQAGGIVVDGSGNACVVGVTASTNFPTMIPLQTRNAGGTDVFVAKLNSTGSGLMYSTYLGGGADDAGWGIARDNSGNIYVTGNTSSEGFPTTGKAFDQTLNSDLDVFVSKISASGMTLLYSTFLGGSGPDNEFYGDGDITVDSTGNAYVCGATSSSDFPTSRAFQNTFRGQTDGFISKLNSEGSALAFSTFLGGSDFDEVLDIAVDSLGNGYVTGETRSTDFPTANALQPNNAGESDCFIVRLSNTGSTVAFSTYLGGSGNDNFLYGDADIALDPSGNICVTGSTSSPDFPTTSPLQPVYGGGQFDVFVLKLNSMGSSFKYCTFLGGNNDDHANGIAVDKKGSVYVTGGTRSLDYPVTDGSAQSTSAGGGMESFISVLSDTTSVNQPDLLVKRRTEPDSAYGINNTYQAAPSGSQIESQYVVPTATVTYDLKMENDGNTIRTFILKAQESSEAGWTVRYRAGAADITAPILSANGYQTVRRMPRKSQIINVDMTPARTVQDGTSKSTTVSVYLDSGEIKARDSVKATSTVPPDITATASVPAGTVTVGQKYTVTINVLRTATTGGFRVDFYINRSTPPGPKTKGDNYFNVVSGSSAVTQKITFTAKSSGPLKSWVQVDTYGVVLERREDNNVSAVNYVSQALSISGSIRDGSNQPVSGVTVSAACPSCSTTTKSVLTDAQGNYTLPGLEPGVHVVTPTRKTYSFDPVSQTVSLSSTDATGVDFLGAGIDITASIDSISQQMTPDGGSAMVATVTVSWAGFPDKKFWVDFYWDRASRPGSKVKGDNYTTVTPTAGNSSTTLTFSNAGLIQGNHTAYVQVDTDMSVDEVDEINNVIGPFGYSLSTFSTSKSLSVSSPRPPTPSDEGVRWVQSPPTLGVPGMNYSVAWEIAAGYRVEETYIIAAPKPEDLSCSDTPGGEGPTCSGSGAGPLLMTEATAGGPGIYRAWVPAPSSGSLCYQVVAIVDGRRMTSNIVTVFVK
ncbi:MAG: SBBP repeat-containing protein [Armatimonadetes bacterium]|nr:SBBP repeat-containing protein [Armatimonadota bacterium]